MPATSSAPSATDRAVLPALRPPATPLIACDPYFSVWSFSDRLTDDWTRHWTGKHQPLAGLVRIDGRAFRFLGPQPKAVEAMEQTGLEVHPTRTIYRFHAAGVDLTLTFATPALPDDLDLISWPVTYLDVGFAARDGRPHRVELYLHVCGQIAVDHCGQKVQWSRWRFGGVESVAIGTHQQQVLERSGDDLRIDWGWCHLAVPADQGRVAVSVHDAVERAFLAGAPPPARDDTSFPRVLADGYPKLCATFAIEVAPGAAVSRTAVIAYDDLYAIEFLHRRLRAYWRRDGRDAGALIEEAFARRGELLARCSAFDAELEADLASAGGERYARLCALAYRQCIAAHKTVADLDGRPLSFSKENFSNGCIATVDVTYPGAPFFLLFNPRLLEGQLAPILEYAGTPRWRFPFAPHDLGTYPLANGQVYGGGERDETNQMPVEECGNLLLLVAALAKVEGSPRLALKHWTVLTRWAEYLRQTGFDPDMQLCTDDFAGHLAHNTNLSIKAILAIGAYARLCAMRGLEPEAAQWRQTAIGFARQWVAQARDGDHYRLCFDRPGTWSQKYNLVWDRLLELDLFPAEVATTEMAFYRTQQKTYGLPLDGRKDYTKIDWILWTATLTGKQDDFEALVAPLYRWLNETPTRVPMTDWYWTTDGRQEGFQARSVVGGLFIKLMADAALWRKWAKRAQPAAMAAER